MLRLYKVYRTLVEWQPLSCCSQRMQLESGIMVGIISQTIARSQTTQIHPRPFEICLPNLSDIGGQFSVSQVALGQPYTLFSHRLPDHLNICTLYREMPVHQVSQHPPLESKWI